MSDPRYEFVRVHCFPCGGSGRIKGKRNTNLITSHDRRRRAICQDCQGNGWTEQRRLKGSKK